MIPHDQAVEELLAGYALGSLTGADAERAEELLTEHVPGCLTCRRLLDGFRGVVGDLALSAGPRQSPAGLWESLQRVTAEPDVAAPHRRRVPVWAMAGAAVALLGLAGWNAMLNQRVGRQAEQQSVVASMATLLGRDDARVVPMSAKPGRSEPRMSMAYTPGGPTMFLIGSGVPKPRKHFVYQLWLTVDARPVASLGTFLPDDGVVIIPITADPDRFEGIWITEEPEGGSSSPTGEPLVVGTLGGG